jgi:hypothetical protein
MQANIEINKETDWRNLFQVEQPRHLNIEHGECDANCLQAKELKCTCRCGGKNHGSALRQGVKSLDSYTEKNMKAEYSQMDSINLTELVGIFSKSLGDMRGGFVPVQVRRDLARVPPRKVWGFQ